MKTVKIVVAVVIAMAVIVLGLTCGKGQVAQAQQIGVEDSWDNEWQWCDPTPAQVDSMDRLIKAANPEIMYVMNKIKVGQQVRIPTSGGMMVYEVEDWMFGRRENKKLRNIGHAFLVGALDSRLKPDTAKPVIQTTPSYKVTTLNQGQAKVVAMPWWALALLVVVLALLAMLLFSPRWTYGRTDPRRYRAVIKGGLSSDVATATNQLQTIIPAATIRAYGGIRTVEPGKLICRQSYGSTFFTLMSFGDGTNRNVAVRDHERIHRVTFSGNTVMYFRTACANGMFVGQADLPTGWEFVPDVSSGQVSTPQVVTAPSPTAVPVSVEDGQYAVTITVTKKVGDGPEETEVIKIDSRHRFLRRIQLHGGLLDGTIVEL